MEHIARIQTNDGYDLNNLSQLSKENNTDYNVWWLGSSLSKRYDTSVVDGINIQAGQGTNNIQYYINQGYEVCVWGVQTENGSKTYENNGATWIMTDNLLDTTPYQEGQEDFNKQ